MTVASVWLQTLAEWVVPDERTIDSPVYEITPSTFVEIKSPPWFKVSQVGVVIYVNEGITFVRIDMWQKVVVVQCYIDRQMEFPHSPEESGARR